MTDTEIIEQLRQAGFNEAADRMERLVRKRVPPDNKRSPASDAMRQAGYIALPRWWVTGDQFEVIERMASGNKDEFFRIKMLCR